MLPKWHVLFGAVVSLIFFLFLRVSLFNSLVIFLSSFLIDVDHYLYYIYRKKDLSLSKSFDWFVRLDEQVNSMPREKRKRFWYAFCFFHSLEVILLFVFIGAFLKIYFLFFVSIGFLSHILLDAAQMIHRGDNPFIVLSVSYKLFEMKTKKNFETKVK